MNRSVSQSRSQEGDGKKLPPAMIMFDAPVLELIDSKIGSALEQGNYSQFGNRPIHLDPIHFKPKDVDLRKSNQLSLYIYVYSLPQTETKQDQISLTTGTTSVSCYNFVGYKTVWKSINLSSPMIGIGYKNNNKLSV